MVTLRLLSIEHLEVYRELRLFGLQESPTAFGSSYELESAQEVEFFEERIQSMADRWVLGAFDDTALIGVVGFIRHTGVKTKHRGDIWGMYVHPDWRGQGIGRQLMEAMLKRIDVLPGLRWVRLGVADGNSAAEKLYQSLGFQRYGSEPEVLCVDGRYYGEHHLARRMSGNH